ncbi:MAG TPA: hypothetical protein VF312_07090 [Propionibacteriaceae bacterium]
MLDRLGLARADDSDLAADLVLMLQAASMGAMVDLDAARVSLLAAAGCGLLIDA